MDLTPEQQEILDELKEKTQDAVSKALEHSPFYWDGNTLVYRLDPPLEYITVTVSKDKLASS